MSFETSDEMTRSIILVPPFIKYSAGPLLGPALLQGAARLRGHRCTVVDLNAHYIQSTPTNRWRGGNFIGDHDKPEGDILGCIEREFISSRLINAMPDPSANFAETERRLKFGFLSHGEVKSAGRALASSHFGYWAQQVLSERVSNKSAENPEVIGVSIMHAGQVVPATALSMIVRSVWPRALIVWGGPHISGIGHEALEADIGERTFAADIFVTGHAEEAFSRILDQVPNKCGGPLSQLPYVVKGTAAVSSKVIPVFEDLSLYDRPLTLPAQSTLGCSFGRCAFCTYPCIEGKPTRLNLDTSVGSVATLAEEVGALLSIKDSLATSTRLLEIGSYVADRGIRWSACTKLSRRLTSEKLRRLEETGLATLEIGLESLLPETQNRISKVQPQKRFEEFVSGVATTRRLSIVVNYIVGFPWEDAEKALEKIEDVYSVLEDHGLIVGGDHRRARIELNHFELERLAPMARYPEAYGMRVVKMWPWASVLEYWVPGTKSEVNWSLKS